MNRVILGILVLFVTPSLLSAHPGRTASDGCHYCRTNCEKWGVPEGERHCHGNRIEEIHIKKVKLSEGETPSRKENQKVPGWEYRLNVEKTSNLIKENEPIVNKF